jgi:hypothetical protein
MEPPFARVMIGSMAADLSAKNRQFDSLQRTRNVGLLFCDAIHIIQ